MMDDKTKKLFKRIYFITPIIGVAIGFFYIKMNEEDFSQREQTIQLIYSLETELNSIKLEKDSLLSATTELQNNYEKVLETLTKEKEEYEHTKENLTKIETSVTNKTNEIAQLKNSFQKKENKYKEELSSLKTNLEKCKLQNESLESRINQIEKSESKLVPHNYTYEKVVIEHTVRKGEALGMITDYYNSHFPNNSIKIIDVAKKNKLEEPYPLKVNQKLLIELNIIKNE